MTSVTATPVGPHAEALSPAVEGPPAGAAGRAGRGGAPGAPGDVLLRAAAEPKAAASAKATKAAATKTTKKTTSKTSKSGYASSGTLPKDLAFLRDPKLSLEEKLMRFLAYMNARSEAEITQKMEEMGGGTAKKASGSTSKSGASKTPKKKGFWGKLLDTAKVLPGLGLTLQALKSPKTRDMLKQLGGPVLGAAATALGFPQAGPLLAKLGPKIVDYAAAGVQAIEKAASAEEKAAAGASSTASGSSAGAAGGVPGRSDQLQMMELQQLVERQKEMFSLVSNMLRSIHDTRAHIISNVR
jgi:hypothetical protein